MTVSVSVSTTDLESSRWAYCCVTMSAVDCAVSSAVSGFASCLRLLKITWMPAERLWLHMIAKVFEKLKGIQNKSLKLQWQHQSALKVHMQFIYFLKVKKLCTQGGILTVLIFSWHLMLLLSTDKVWEFQCKALKKYSALFQFKRCLVQRVMQSRMLSYKMSFLKSCASM